MNQTIYIALIDEGVDVWRPVKAKPMGDDLFLLLGPVPPDELWEFQPGQVVRCREKAFSSNERGLVAYEEVSTSA
jgi:hypothetical protein